MYKDSTYRVLITLFAGLLSFTVVWAQFTPSQIDIYDELSGTVIYDILPDKKGNVWIASIGGLVKYDGYEFKFFQPDPTDSTTIGDLLVYSLYEEKDGTIWIGSFDEIYKYNPITQLFKTYSFKELLEYPDISQPMAISIEADGQGRLYFGTISGIGIDNIPSIVTYDRKNDQIIRISTEEGIEPRGLNGMSSVSNGSVFIIAENGGFLIDSTGKMSAFDMSIIDLSQFKRHESPLNLTQGENGSIWFITNQSRLGRFDLDGSLKLWDYGKLFNGDHMWRPFAQIEFDKQGNIWIPGEYGVIFFDRKTEELTKVGQQLIEANQLTDLTVLKIDTFGNLWGGTRGKGLFKFPNRNFLTAHAHKANDPESIEQGWINKILESSDGYVWFSSENGMYQLDPNTNHITKYPYREIFPDRYRIMMLGEVAPGEFIFNTNRGIEIYSISTRQIKSSDFNTIQDQIFYTNDLLRDKDGTLLLATANGIFRLRDKEIKHFDLTLLEQSDGPSNEVTKIIESKSKTGYWIQTNGGLFFMDKATDEIKRYGYDGTKGFILSSQDINSLYEDDHGILWVGTWQGGLNRLNPETGEIKVFGIADGLPSMSIQGILGDEKNGALWLSTFSGISRFNIQEEQFMNFGLEDGIQSLLYADGSYLETSGGLFVFGGSNGINIFDPDKISENSIPPLVEITAFKKGDKSIALHLSEDQSEKATILKSKENNISIYYTGIHYDNPSKNKFAYQLENYDNDWRDVGPLRTAYYYNLSPGNYVFKVKAANANGVWSEEVKLAFSILPPWWRTWWAYLLFSILILSAGYMLYRAQKQRILDRERAVAREKELKQAKEIEKAYTELKSTQAQLIQSEKMASLGELTAGIAHEIQNPLNFVNNFSEVNSELIDELTEELDNQDYDEVRAIAKDIKENELKINHHGKRADAIVKGMLQHSRTSTGQKELTDINALCDEYLRLSYHACLAGRQARLPARQGLRAKDKSFNADFQTNFDPNLPKVNVIPQDIGRVLLNLIINAFYAVNDKSEKTSEEYEPTVSVSTKNLNDSIEISVKDNGNGIPDSIKEKIFQPFFTTKPTGQGTGLGLSLSYDIVKAHGGELKVETKEGEGSEFIIQLNLV